MSRMALMRMLTDGDILARKVRRRIGRRDFPRIEPIEADRVGPEMAGITMREGQVSGVFFNRFGEPTEYEYFDRDRFGSFRNGRRIPANEMLHLYDEERFDAYRGVSHFRFGSLEHSRDLREIIRAEKTGVKNHSKFAALIKNMTGGVEGDDDSINLTESSSETPKAKKEDMPDGIMQRMEPGEDLQLLASNRPTQAWQGFVEMLVNDCAVSMELPVQFVWNLVGLGGPSTRFMLRQAGRVFSSKMDLFEEKWLIPIATWIIAMEIEQGRLDRNPQWMRFEPQRPAMPGIDAGREAKANVDEYTQGFLSGQDVVSQQGRNFREVTRERAREAKDQIDIAEEFDIPLWMLRDKPPGAVSPTEDDTSQNDNARSDRAPAS